MVYPIIKTYLSLRVFIHIKNLIQDSPDFVRSLFKEAIDIDHWIITDFFIQIHQLTHFVLAHNPLPVLFSAIEFNQYQLAFDLISNGADGHVINHHLHPLMFYALLCHQPNMVLHLLHHRANTDFEVDGISFDDHGIQKSNADWKVVEPVLVEEDMINILNHLN